MQSISINELFASVSGGVISSGDTVRINGHLIVKGNESDTGYISSVYDKDVPNGESKVFISDATFVDNLLESGLPITVGGNVLFYYFVLIQGSLVVTNIEKLIIEIDSVQWLRAEDDDFSMEIDFMSTTN